jgi:hypothetical protein
VVVDSYHACCRTLGLTENDAEMADPVLMLLEAIAPHRGTLLVVHHANKAGANGSAAVASRGSSSAACCCLSNHPAPPDGTSQSSGSPGQKDCPQNGGPGRDASPATDRAQAPRAGTSMAMPRR